MTKDNSLYFPLITYEAMRSIMFSAEFAVLHSLQYLIPGSEKYRAKLANHVSIEMRKAVRDLLRQDAKNIAEGVYPLSVLKPESPVKHVRRIPGIMADGWRLYKQRYRGRTTEFNPEARDYLDDVPRYYQRNFHFQSDGYLSRRSARFYEHQVEMLFGGAADAMRRLIIAPLREKFGDTDGHGLKFLEIGAGTGRATRFVHLAFPKAKIVAVDLSDPYLKTAERKLGDLPRIDFMQADGANLPFQDGIFDAAYSVFLYHEMPLEARTAVIADSMRVLKRKGFFGFVDSIQVGDKPAFDTLLEKFPMTYHEPFYRNYSETPMQQLLKDGGVKHIKSDMGFFSKVCWGSKSA